ncbi:EpsD family peptidyl-prolyl cis-trans isomerase [Candidatus Methylopumilus turicensis]|uniref:Peptidyl-prolyl cis-trans isomerase, EpsD family n=1 Tax=Candidatus Methylopumilus turicensis TaxID=1581680 RepID=A0A0B7IVK9_9PROT|nr:EpsD family peptidyl-prolyl cis-trans isomerase [Candidatus Methylopumilus turicensis]CEN56260.1 Peptidyl-prolyl cis-trans isomerase, EpsD family [Candidatus Methylopumilus turicensis]
MHSNSHDLLKTSKPNLAKLVLMIALVGLVAGCGKKQGGDEKSSQSLVSVDGEEITVYQVNNELQRANIQPAQQEAASRQILQGLVDRQILLQAAHKEKLDRKPQVMQAIENSKMQILAQAYLQERLASVAKPTSAEIEEYRAQHQDIFANRKVYVTDEAVFALEAGSTESLQEIAKSEKTLKDLEGWLKSHQVKYAVKRVAHAAETLPPQLLAQFGKMAVGQMVFIGANGPNTQAMAVSMAEIKEMPISEKDSKPLIERILTEEKRKQTAEAELKRLRETAKIRYIDKKFDPANAPKVEKPVEAAKPADNAQEEAKKKMESSVSKGLNGL